jgi:hypothetical protein
MCALTGSAAMSEVIDNTPQEFWRPPVIESAEVPTATGFSPTSVVCAHCATEFLVGSNYCHTCGSHRPGLNVGFWQQKLAWLGAAKADLFPGEFGLPGWLRYLHFHEIKRWIGLPTAAFVSFMVGLGCVAGAIGVGLFYKASNLAEFQAVQLWRIEWLLAATAAFVAGILLKKPDGMD